MFILKAAIFNIQISYSQWDMKNNETFVGL